MKTIYRYSLLEGHGAKTAIKTYNNCKILGVGIDPRNTLSVWILVDTKEEMNNTVNFYVAGTGFDFEAEFNNPQYVGTVKEGPCMWHVFYENSTVELE